jgi:predicted nucleic acid-binding protein
VLVVEILSREFNQDVSRAKRAAQDGPVIITDRDKPAYVLMRHETYRHLVGDGPTICELLDCQGVEDRVRNTPLRRTHFPACRPSTMFLLDTNVLLELRRRDRTDKNVATWANSVHASDLFLSAITILEIEAGTLTLLSRNPTQGAVLRKWIDNRVPPAFRGRILAVDTEVAQRCATLHVPNPRAERDALIAATALAYRFQVVTRNVADFAPREVASLNPWNPTNANHNLKTFLSP